jgi:uncharacterized protein (DUF983 family)
MQRLLHTLWVTGLRLKCPACEQGKLFRSYFKLYKTCPHCGVRFERETGEEAGGMSLSIVILGVIFLLVYPLTELFTDWSLWVHLAIWLPFSILFPILFYPYSRSLWVVFLYLTGSVHQDPIAYRDTNLTFIDALHNRQEQDKPTDSEK